jgi:hypothetical protein
MRDGLYKVAFQTAAGSGAGVAVLESGTIRGGDSMMFYTGTFSEAGSQFTARVLSKKHSNVPGMGSVFGRDEVNISLNTATVHGTAVEAPGVTFLATLALLVAK